MEEQFRALAVDLLELSDIVLKYLLSRCRVFRESCCKFVFQLTFR